MTKKYYYDCPIKALYMMREFGVNFSEAHGTNHADKFFQINESELCDFATGVIEDFRGIEQIYVKPESEHIFEPKEDDIGLYSKPFLRKLINFNALRFDGENWIYLNQNEDNAGFYDQVDLNSSRVDIIDRDGKHFFNPKEEN